MTKMLSCGHEKTPFGVPLCSHLRTCRQPGLHYVKWYIGSGLENEFVCVPCAEAREKGGSSEAEFVCQECFEYATTKIGYLARAGGKPEIRVLSTSFNSSITATVVPSDGAKIIDIAPVNQAGRSIWLLLAEDGRILQFDAESGRAEIAGCPKLPPEAVRDSFRDHSIKMHLHASQNGEFAAVVNDYGQYGQVVDLRSGKVTLELDGEDYCPETVPFSLAFANWQGQVVVIHRTAWNRLDISDAASGRLLSERGPTSYRQGEQRPQHYLDYFHGALYLSPKGTHILDDGWVWHPVGVAVVWSIDHWLSENVWESEDGATRREVCDREYYWDHGVAWLDEETVAIGGIGDDDTEIVDGARIFDITSTASAGPRWRSDLRWAREVTAFAGPAGRFFSDGAWLYSSGKDGMSRWDPKTGAQTGHIEGFCPTHYHMGSSELVQLAEGTLLRWSTSDLS
jgi:hypothetical protein